MDALAAESASCPPSATGSGSNHGACGGPIATRFQGHGQLVTCLKEDHCQLLSLRCSLASSIATQRPTETQQASAQVHRRDGLPSAPSQHPHSSWQTLSRQQVRWWLQQMPAAQDQTHQLALTVSRHHTPLTPQSSTTLWSHWREVYDVLKQQLLQPLLFRADPAGVQLWFLFKFPAASMQAAKQKAAEIGCVLASTSSVEHTAAVLDCRYYTSWSDGANCDCDLLRSGPSLWWSLSSYVRRCDHHQPQCCSVSQLRSYHSSRRPAAGRPNSAPCCVAHLHVHCRKRALGGRQHVHAAEAGGSKSRHRSAVLLPLLSAAHISEQHCVLYPPHPRRRLPAQPCLQAAWTALGALHCCLLFLPHTQHAAAAHTA